MKTQATETEAGHQIPCRLATCPPSNSVDQAEYRDRVIRTAQWSEAAGCEAVLIGTDNSLVDPWVTAQIIIENTDTICPLVAVQPIYMHPYWVAKRIATTAYVYGRQVWINLVAGGFRNDLVGLGDEAQHDHRYARIVEYATVIRQLLESPRPVTFEGTFYQVHNLKMTPPLHPTLRPRMTLSGSSEAAVATARTLDATLIQYPLPAHQYDGKAPPSDVRLGIRIGIIARDREDEAWTVARGRFPIDRRGQLAHALAEQGTDATWHAQLCEASRNVGGEASPYWLLPFENYHEYCPYLVGSHDAVAAEIAKYGAAGYGTVLLGVPDNAEDLAHAGIVLDRVEHLHGAPASQELRRPA